MFEPSFEHHNPDSITLVLNKVIYVEWIEESHVRFLRDKNLKRKGKIM